LAARPVQRADGVALAERARLAIQARLR